MSVIVDEPFLRDFATRWLQAWNSHDTDEVLSLLHPDITWDDTVFWPEVIHGLDGMRSYVDRIWTAMPDVAFEEVQLFTATDAGRAVCLFRQYGHGPASHAPDATFSTFGCDIFLAFTDGLLAHYLGQYEINELMRQLGMLPPRAGKIGGAYLLSLTGRPATPA